MCIHFLGTNSGTIPKPKRRALSMYLNERLFRTDTVVYRSSPQSEDSHLFSAFQLVFIPYVPSKSSGQ